MYWQEENKKDVTISDEVQDLVYKIRCASLPVDHAFALAEEIISLLPWMASETGAGIHSIHVADSGNGWMRPENPDALLHLSRRTKLILRVPKNRLESALSLVDETLDIAGNKMTIESVEQRPLSKITTLFSRYLVFSEQPEPENIFLDKAMQALQEIDIIPKKLLPGLKKTIQKPGKMIKTRSLMIAGLSAEESFRLQQRGLGLHHHLGCGIFIPHKDIEEIGKTPE